MDPKNGADSLIGREEAFEGSSLLGRVQRRAHHKTRPGIVLLFKINETADYYAFTRFV